MNAGGADSFSQEAEALPALTCRSIEKTPVFALGQFPVLDAEAFDFAVLPAQEFQQTVDGGEHGVDGGGGAGAAGPRIETSSPSAASGKKSTVEDFSILGYTNVNSTNTRRKMPCPDAAAENSGPSQS